MYQQPIKVRCYIAAAIGGGISALTSGINSAMNAKQLAEQRKFQQQENQKDRDFNSSEAQKSRNYQSRMYYEDRNWNSVSNQMKQYSDAGLNPSLMMSTGAQSIQGTMPSAPAASSHGSALPSGSTNNITTGFDPLTTSQVQKNLADAENTKEDTKSKEIQNYIDDMTKYGEISLRAVNLRLAQNDLQMSTTKAGQYAEELYLFRERTSRDIDRLTSETNLLDQEAGIKKEEWQSQQYQNFIKYYRLGYRLENSDDAIDAIGHLVSTAFLSSQTIQNESLLASIRKDIAAANESITRAKINGFTIEELKYDHEQGAYKARINNNLYTWTVDNNLLICDLDLWQDDSYKQGVKETKQAQQDTDRRHAKTQSYTVPISDVLKPVAESLEIYTTVKTKGFSSLKHDNDDTSFETISERDVIDKNGDTRTLRTRTYGGKSRTGSSRTKGRR